MDTSDAHYTRMDAVVLAPVKLTPRSWLACERTLLAWLHIATILSAVSTGVLFRGTASGVGTCAILMLIPAISFVIYATRMYYIRIHQLKHRQLSSYYDQDGPFWMTVIMCFAVLMNLVGRIWSALTPHLDAFDYNDLEP